MRSYLYNTVLPKFPEILKNNLKPIIKNTQNIDILETIWLPSYEEVTKNGIYYPVLGENIWKVKTGENISLTSAWKTYFLRDGYVQGNIKKTLDKFVNPSEYWVSFGFCLGTANKYLE